MVRYATATLVFADEVERAQAQIAAVRADTLSRGSIDAHLSGLTWGALLALRVGELAAAEADARAALELSRPPRGGVGADVVGGAVRARCCSSETRAAEADSVLTRRARSMR